MRILLVAMAIALLAGPGFGQAFRIVPLHYATLQDAVDAADHGDTVLVMPGTYAGFDFKGKAILVRSIGGASQTVLLAAFSTSTLLSGEPEALVTARSGEQQDSILEGFTLRGRYGAPGSSGVSRGLYIAAANPIIRDCVVENHWSGNGMDGYQTSLVSQTYMQATSGKKGACALVSSGASPRFERCIFRNNRGGVGGRCAGITLFSGEHLCSGPDGADGAAGIALRSAAATLVDCEFTTLGFGGVFSLNVGSFLALRDCRIDGFEGSAISSQGTVDMRRTLITNQVAVPPPPLYSYYGSFEIQRPTLRFSGGQNYLLSCAIVGNAGLTPLSGVQIEHCTFADNRDGVHSFGGVTAQNSIFWNDLDPNQPASAHIEWTNWDPSTIVESCLFRGTPHPGPGNITSPDAGFVDAANGDYHLRWDSPAVNAGQTGVISPNNTDIDRQPRRLGSGFDMGADEAVCVGLGRLEDPAASGETLDLSWIEGQTSTPLAGELVGSGAEANAVGVAALALAPGMAMQGNLTLHLDAGNLLAGFVNFDANGEFRLPMDVGDPSLAGSVVYMQLFASESTGVRSSNGLEIIFCN